jgi:hypothetical protein
LLLLAATLLGASIRGDKGATVWALWNFEIDGWEAFTAS